MSVHSETLQEERLCGVGEYTLILAFLAASVVACLAVPSWRRTPLGDLNLFYLIPGLPLCYVMFHLAALSGGPDSIHHRVRHQAAAIMMAGSAPFFSWWSRAPDNDYLTIMMGVATVVLVWFMVEVLILLRRISEDNGMHDLAMLALRTEPLAAILFGGPAIAVWIAGAAARLWHPSLPPDEVRRLWDAGPKLLPMAGLTAGAAIAWIAWETSRRLLKQGCAPRTPEPRPRRENDMNDS